MNRDIPKFDWNNLERDKKMLRVFAKEIRTEINDIWDEILFDGFEMCNCCAIPQEMYESILRQIAKTIAVKLYVLEIMLERTPNCGLLSDYFGGKIYKYYREMDAKLIQEPEGN